MDENMEQDEMDETIVYVQSERLQPATWIYGGRVQIKGKQ